MKKDLNKYPKGWNRDRIDRVIAHYDSQTEAEAIAEAEAAVLQSDFALIRVPLALADEVRALVARRQKKGSRLRKSA
ncbi:MAG: hypothetical protein ACREJD_16775 [Phycisphaerales bacterium]